MRIQGKVSEKYNSTVSFEDNVIEKVKYKKPNFAMCIVKYVELKYLEIFWFSLYTLILLAIFAERAYYYSVEREHTGLRRIAGYGVTVTRGAASAMMFTYSSLLVTMCRNTITYLRDSVVSKYFPWDSFIGLHKYIAYWALFFTLVHIIGHAFNFYHISTQTADDLTCLFRNFFHATHELPKFHYWCWQTITGFTGILLALLTTIIYVFALPIIRRKLYDCFLFTHKLYPVFYILTVLHGAGRLVQEPFFYYFFLGPIILFTLDNVATNTRRKVRIPVLNAEFLPSDVTMLEIKKPDQFTYKSGQWVRISINELNSYKYHPFTLTSSPNEKNLTLHIRSVGPWTNQLRRICEEAKINNLSLPMIYLDGPYGEGHQDWNRYDVFILIGGGIGVTPFASILKDIAFQSNNNGIRNKKVYFLWVCRNQRQFEWMIDIIRKVEYADVNKIVTCHIFITQFYEKFDLRTVLLYVFERHFQRISKRSLFTNLLAVTHFGRPNFYLYFKNIQNLHETNLIGVFSCGPRNMTNQIEAACLKLNKITASGATFEHHYKNF